MMGETPDDEIERDRLGRLAESSEGLSPGWEATFSPDSFGGHELLDRLSVAVDYLDRTILDHPACILNPEWFAAASRAVEMLAELYQAVGAEQSAGDE